MQPEARRASAIIREQAPTIIEEVMRLGRARWPELHSALAEEQLAKARRDIGFHLDFLSSAVRVGEQALFDDYLDFVKVTFRSRSMPVEWLSGGMADIASTLRSHWGTEVRAGAEMLERAAPRILEPDVVVDTFVDAARPWGTLAVLYLSAILNGDRHGACDPVLDAVTDGASVADMHLHVIQPAQRELGRLWQLNRITVAREHRATAVTQFVISRLSTAVPAPEADARTVVTTCTEGDLHDVGIRIVSESLTSAGFDVIHLGGNTPTDAIIETVTESGADVLALSTSMTSHLYGALDVIDAVRARPAIAATRIIVGGHPFMVVPGMWQSAGASGAARDAQDTVTLATELV